MRQRPLKSASIGFAISMLPVFAIFLWLYLSAETVAGQVALREPDFAQAMVRGTREFAIYTVFLLAGSLGIHWLLAGFLGKRRVHDIASANCLLTLGFAAFLVVAANDLYGWIDTYCDQLPFPHSGFQITRISECPSSVTFFNGMQTASFALLALSFIVRTFVSHLRS